MYSVVFEGFGTKEQAIAFAEWYSGAGEQDVGMWLEEHGIEAANVSCIKPGTTTDDVVVELDIYYTPTSS